MNDDRWPTEWMRGVLATCVLAVVAERETYGYLVAQRLQSAGLGTVKGGTLYPILTRFENEGLVTSRWEPGDGGPGRKYFTVTSDGLAKLGDLTRDWDIFTERVAALVALQTSTRRRTS